jgi:hypothetical protein
MFDFFIKFDLIVKIICSFVGFFDNILFDSHIFIYFSNCCTFIFVFSFINKTVSALSNDNPLIPTIVISDNTGYIDHYIKWSL